MRVDPGDAAGLVSGIQIEVGFRTHRFHDLHLGFHALRILFRFRPFGTDLFRTDSENDILVEIILRFGIPLFRKTNGEGVRFEENIFSDLFKVSVEKVHRRSSDKAGDKDIGLIVINMMRGIHLLNDAVFHHADAVSHGHCLDLVVGHVDHGCFQTCMELGDFRPHLHAHFRIKIGKRFVKQKDLRLADDSPSDRDTLTLSSGKRLRLSLKIIMDSQNFRSLVHTLVNIGLRKFAEFEAESKIVIYGHMGIERIVLEHHRNIPVLGRDVIDNARTDGDCSRADLFQSGNHPQGCGFSASRRTDEHHELPVFDFEVNMFDCKDSSIIHLADIF